MSPPPRLILGSTSRYRRELLERLRLPFDVARPDTDETPLAGEAPEALGRRLARAKAANVAARHPEAWVIGSDQVAEFDGRPLGKPGNHAAAADQLRAMSGQSVRFLTGLCLMRGDGEILEALDCTVVRFRALATDEIERYLAAEQPYDCAGSFKSEGLGITLFDAIETRDPTALIGLPLIATARLLREAGFALP
jgi:septum formation protein